MTSKYTKKLKLWCIINIQLPIIYQVSNIQLPIILSSIYDKSVGKDPFNIPYLWRTGGVSVSQENVPSPSICTASPGSLTWSVTQSGSNSSSFKNFCIRFMDTAHWNNGTKFKCITYPNLIDPWAWLIWLLLIWLISWATAIPGMQWWMDGCQMYQLLIHHSPSIWTSTMTMRRHVLPQSPL